jgi:hypothetical protein
MDNLKTSMLFTELRFYFETIYETVENQYHYFNKKSWYDKILFVRYHYRTKQAYIPAEALDSFKLNSPGSVPHFLDYLITHACGCFETTAIDDVEMTA